MIFVNNFNLLFNIKYNIKKNKNKVLNLSISSALASASAVLRKIIIIKQFYQWDYVEVLEIKNDTKKI